MNVLKPHLQTTVKLLLEKSTNHREISRNTGADRKTIRKYGQLSNLVPPKDNMHSNSLIDEQVDTGCGVGSRSDYCHHITFCNPATPPYGRGAIQVLCNSSVCIFAE